VGILYLSLHTFGSEMILSTRQRNPATEYLFDDTERGDKEEKKYRRIIKNLEEIYSKFPDYKLMITGHRCVVVVVVVPIVVCRLQ